MFAKHTKTSANSGATLMVNMVPRWTAPCAAIVSIDVVSSYINGCNAALQAANQPRFGIRVGALDAHQDRTPGKPATKGFHQDKLTGLDATVSATDIEGHRYGCR